MGQRQSRPWIVPELWSLIEPLLPREYLPQELGFGSGRTCRRRLAAWNEADVWDQVHQLPLNKLRSKTRAANTTSSPAANHNDVTQLSPLWDKIPAVSGFVGRPRRRPDTLFADRGYDHDKYRRLLRQRGIRPAIAERGPPHGTGLDTFRQVVERTISWLDGFRRLRIRWETT